MYGIMVKALAISLHSGNSTFAPSGWFMHAWSHIYIQTVCMFQHLEVVMEHMYCCRVPGPLAFPLLSSNSGSAPSAKSEREVS